MVHLPKSVRRLALVLALATPAFVFATAPHVATPATAKVPTLVKGPALAATQAVAIKMFAFTPQVLTVAPGTTVIWTNVDEDPHTVTATDRSFHSAALDTDDKYSFTFTRPGDYAYFCSLHPRMTGKIIVK